MLQKNRVMLRSIIWSLMVGFVYCGPVLGDFDFVAEIQGTATTNSKFTPTGGTAVNLSGLSFDVKAVFADSPYLIGSPGDGYYHISSLTATVGGTTYTATNFTSGVHGYLVYLRDNSYGYGYQNNWALEIQGDQSIRSHDFYPVFQNVTNEYNAMKTPTPTVYSNFLYSVETMNLPFETSNGVLDLYTGGPGISASINYATPEPSSYALLALGMICLGAWYSSRRCLGESA